MKKKDEGTGLTFQAYLAQEVDRVKGHYYPVHAPFLQRILNRETAYGKLHPNPEDEFCNPEIGPNYGIVAQYEQEFRQDIQFRTGGYEERSILEPLIVQKARPDGYMILNGHHRWAAAYRAGIDRMKIKIVNLTQLSDIREMLKGSQSDRRVTLDLDEVVFCEAKDAEKPLPFPLRRFYPERIRKGIPALLHFLNERDYDIWVYTSKYYSIEYIRYFFLHWSVRLTGIITGTAQKGAKAADEAREMKKMVDAKYKTTVHIDKDLVLRTFSGSKDCEEYPLSGKPETWAREIMDVFTKIAQQ